MSVSFMAARSLKLLELRMEEGTIRAYAEIYANRSERSWLRDPR
jgi:hypothetical protein